jgi:hypothetical protein
LDTLKRTASLPTVKDFYKLPTDNKANCVMWNCPAVIDSFRSKYPDFINDDYTSIMFVIDSTNTRVQDMKMYLCTEGAKFLSLNRNNYDCTGVKRIHRREILGWEELFHDGRLPQYKKETIEIINKLSDNLNKLDEIFKHANDVYIKKGGSIWVDYSWYKSIKSIL